MRPSTATRPRDALRLDLRIVVRVALLVFAIVAAGIRPGPAHAQLPIGAETRPEPIPDPDADPNAKKPVPPAKKVELKRTGKTVYKCGEEYTDQPVCADQSKPTRMKLSAEDEKRCDDFKKNNFFPWYCRK
jgi:hypothetical protein